MAHDPREQLPRVFRIGRFEVYWSEVANWSTEAAFQKPVLHIVNLYDGTWLKGVLSPATAIEEER